MSTSALRPNRRPARPSHMAASSLPARSRPSNATACNVLGARPWLQLPSRQSRPPARPCMLRRRSIRSPSPDLDRIGRAEGACPGAQRAYPVAGVLAQGTQLQRPLAPAASTLPRACGFFFPGLCPRMSLPQNRLPLSGDMLRFCRMSLSRNRLPLSGDMLGFCRMSLSRNRLPLSGHML